MSFEATKQFILHHIKPPFFVRIFALSYFSKAVEQITIGEKIKKIRTFLGVTQKEFGLAVGLEEDYLAQTRRNLTEMPLLDRALVSPPASTDENPADLLLKNEEF